MSLLVVVFLLAGCAGIDAPPAPPAGEPISIAPTEYRVTLQRWEVGDSFRYTLEKFAETTIGTRVDRSGWTAAVRYSGRRRTVEGHVQVGIWVNDVEVIWAMFDRSGRFVDTTTSRETASLLAPLLRFWSGFGRYWDGAVLTSDVSHPAQVSRAQAVSLMLYGGLPAESSAFGPESSVSGRFTGFQRLAGRQTAVIETWATSVAPRPTRVTVNRHDVMAEDVRNESTYHIDTIRGFLVASYSVTRVTGRAGKEPFVQKDVDVLRWNP